MAFIRRYYKILINSWLLPLRYIVRYIMDLIHGFYQEIWKISSDFYIGT